MRVIGGRFRSRALIAPAGIATRPTTDRLRETLFNVLAARTSPPLHGSLFVDLYAGSGAVGIEAISRGAAHCFFIDNAPPAIATLKKNLAALSIAPSQATVFTMDITAFLKNWPQWQSRSSNIVFLDPPYEETIAYTRVLKALGGKSAAAALAKDALIIAEHATPKSRKGVPELADDYGTLHRTRILEQSDAALSFYQRAD
jgi:16S rRNA (guanine(966)-N(2))-methyltransferase RsmD